MSAWGTDIFSDDLAASIRTEYNALLAIGKDGEEAEQIIMRGFVDYVNQNPEEEPVFWFALALAESRKGRLSESVKNQAMYYLNNGGDLERWNEPGDQKKYLKRVQVIENLRETLTGPQPEKKKIRKATVHHCPWPVGSLLAYRIVNADELKGQLIFGKYALLRLVGIQRWPVSKLLPDERYSEKMIVSLYGWCGTEIPDPNITKNLQFIPFNNPQPMPQPTETERVDAILALGAKLLPKEAITNIREHVFNTNVEMCADLDWRPFRHYKPDITCLGQDPNTAEETAEFKTDICSVGMYGLPALDLTLECRLEKYL